MPYYIGNKKIKKIGVLTEPNSYQTTITPADMQMGMTAVSKGKVITGTGKAFEFASYGSRVMESITDKNGIERQGTTFKYDSTTNVIFVAPTMQGNTVLQDQYLVNLLDNTEVTIATDITTGGDLRVYYDGEHLIVYLTKPADESSVLRFFIGKDNHIS